MKIKKEYENDVRRIILSDSLWIRGSKKKKKTLLRKELPNMARWKIDYIVDKFVVFDKVHTDLSHYAKNHEVCIPKEILEQLNINLKNIKKRA